MNDSTIWRYDVTITREWSAKYEPPICPKCRIEPIKRAPDDWFADFCCEYCAQPVSIEISSTGHVIVSMSDFVDQDTEYPWADDV